MTRADESGSLSAVLLAAGRSTRMKSEVPKPLHEVCGRAMLAWLLDAVREAGASRIVVVVGHGRERVTEAFASERDVTLVEQREQLGTGHAVKVALPALSGEGDVIVLAGDLPLVRGASLVQLVNAHRERGASLTLATAEVSDPTGYGRVIRGEDGGFLEIVEELDATPEQREVREVFPSVTCGRLDALRDTLGRVTNDNAKGEYYFTDVFALCGGNVHAVRCVSQDDVVAPNDRAQLAEAGRIMQGRIQASHLSAGVGIADPRTTWIEAGVVFGRNVTVLPFSFVGRGARVADGATVGPFANIGRGREVS